MTHTLHPDTKLIDAIMEEISLLHIFGIYDYCDIKKILSKHLLPPSQHLKDEPTIKKGDIVECFVNDTMGDGPKTRQEGTCIGEGVWIRLKDGDRLFYSFREVNDIDGIRSPLSKVQPKKEELKQSTPKIEKLVYEDILPDGKLDQLAVERNLANIIDYINNKD